MTKKQTKTTTQTTVSSRAEFIKSFYGFSAKKKQTYSSREWTDHCSRQEHPSHQTPPTDDWIMSQNAYTRHTRTEYRAANNRPLANVSQKGANGDGETYPKVRWSPVLLRLAPPGEYDWMIQCPAFCPINWDSPQKRWAGSTKTKTCLLNQHLSDIHLHQVRRCPLVHLWD